MLVSAEELTVKAAALKHVYPGGFVLISDLGRKTLLVDFDGEAKTIITIIDLPMPAD